MERLAEILTRLLQAEGGLFAQIFSVEDPDGTQYHFNASMGMCIARATGQPSMVSLKSSGITPEAIRANYTDLNEAYAMTTDTSRPILFVPHNGDALCVDGHHRLYKAAVLGQAEIPAYFLTQKQAEAITILTLPPGQGLDWGQRAKAS
jgi:hypothetical protein